MMESPDSSKATRAANKAAQAIRKYFTTATAAGMHPDEFWYQLGNEVAPGKKMRPRLVSLADYGKKTRARKARRARQSQLFDRNQKICALFETSVKQGESLRSIYQRIKKLYGVGERRARDICAGERKALGK
jgi:hypothetical protein